MKERSFSRKGGRGGGVDREGVGILGRRKAVDYGLLGEL